MSHVPLVLIADDDERVLKALQTRLESSGLRVLTAADGYTALSQATQEQPDLLVLDVNMPAGDGFSVHERLDKSFGTGGPPVIYLTGDRSERLDDLAEQLGAVAMFHKPFNSKELIDTIDECLRPRAA